MTKSEKDDSTFEDVPLENDYSSKHDVTKAIFDDKPIEKMASVAFNGKQFVVRIPNEVSKELNIGKGTHQMSFIFKRGEHEVKIGLVKTNEPKSL